EVFTPNATRRMELAAQGHAAALAEAGAEFQAAGTTPFDRLVNGLNRLPRPLLALGTLGLFAYAMADPAGFSLRMQGLDTVPEPLWWLLGAVVSFYFGAREAHYFRMGRTVPQVIAAATAQARTEPPAGGADAAAFEAENPALQSWTARDAH
ncbi:MAG: holin family protein, partial [Paracoccaceae bacterium]|nr:holin family protein [Paracoccaceae bacterium]